MPRTAWIAGGGVASFLWMGCGGVSNVPIVEPIAAPLPPPAPPPLIAVADRASPASRSPRESVVLDDGSRVEGTLIEYVDHDHVIVQLDSGEKRRLEWNHITAVSAAGPTTATGVVTLHDGSSVQGDVVDAVAGDHVTVRLANGETRRIAWAEVAGIATGTATSASATSFANVMVNGFAMPDNTAVLVDWPEPDRTPPNIPATRLSIGIAGSLNGPLGPYALAADWVPLQLGALQVGIHAGFGPDGPIGSALSEGLSLEWAYGSSVQQGLGVGFAHGFRSSSAMRDVVDRIDYFDADLSHLSVFLSRQIMVRAGVGLDVPISATCMTAAPCGIDSVAVYGTAALMWNFGGDQ